MPICKECKQDKNLMGHGLCRNCYMRYWYSQRPMGICRMCQHKKRLYSDGLCNNCYQKQKIAALPEQQCIQCGQADKKIRLGLCSKCYKQQWNEQNMAHVLEYTAQWNQEHPERRQTTTHRYRQSPGGKVAHLLNILRRSARIKAAPGEGLSTEAWERILEEHHHRCFYCGASGKMTIEHKIPITRGGAHDPSNVVPACSKCNQRKGTMTTDEYLERLKGEAE